MKIIFGIRFPTILIKDDKMQFLLSLVMWCCLYGIFIQNASFSGVLTLLIMGSIFTTPVVYIICVYVFNDKDKKKIINQKISERKRQINEMLIM